MDADAELQLKLVYVGGVWYAMNMLAPATDRAPTDFWASGLTVDTVLQELHTLYGYSIVLTLVRP
jgi:hypothetical protein